MPDRGILGAARVWLLCGLASLASVFGLGVPVCKMGGLR